MIECLHRGGEIGSHINLTCPGRGMPVRVYHCNLLDAPCILRWWTLSVKRREASGETLCVTCRHRTLEDGTQPMLEYLSQAAKSESPPRVTT